jgi:L,D-peptidoglycan transpeptidase YkuD (ErfK/YbiS/YcfS/YnhG family)
MRGRGGRWRAVCRRAARAGLLGGCLALALWGQGCSDDPRTDAKETVIGKTPVVRPEDVHRPGAGGAAVLSPDYREGLTANLDAPPAAAKKRGEPPALSDPAAKRLFAGQAVAPPTAAKPPAASSLAATPPTTASASAAVTAPSPALPSVQENRSLAAAGPSALQTSPASRDGRSAAAPMGAPGAAQAGAATSVFPVAGCRQLVVVTAKDFSASSGLLRRFARQGPDAPWQEVGGAVPCRLGRNGLGVGRGLVDFSDGPVKKQGDGRTPAGLFRLPEAFGYADEAAARAAGVRLPYAALTDRSACVTAPDSPLFGRIAGPEAREAGGAVRQERMVRDDRANVWGLVVGHNREQPDPGAGACVFVNVRPASGPATGGSVGCPEDVAAGLAAWLDPAGAPVLAVLPEAVYRRERQAWGLP